MIIAAVVIQEKNVLNLINDRIITFLNRKKINTYLNSFVHKNEQYLKNFTIMLKITRYAHIKATGRAEYYAGAVGMIVCDIEMISRKYLM